MNHRSELDASADDEIWQVVALIQYFDSLLDSVTAALRHPVSAAS